MGGLVVVLTVYHNMYGLSIVADSVLMITSVVLLFNIVQNTKPTQVVKLSKSTVPEICYQPLQRSEWSL